MPSGLLRRLASAEALRTLLPYGVVVAAALVAVVLLGQEFERHAAALEVWIDGLGPWGPVTYVALFIVAASLLVPETVLSILAGALFGLGGGIPVVIVANFLAASLQWALARRLLRERIQRALSTRPPLAAIQRAVHRDQLRLQFLLRLTPLNPASISYLLGAAGVRYGSFVIASFGLIPILVIEVYLGWAGKHLVGRAAGGGASTILDDVALVGGLILGGIALVLISRRARRAVSEAVAAEDASDHEAAGAAG